MIICVSVNCNNLLVVCSKINNNYNFMDKYYYYW